jgi:hypothetical protein
VRFTNQDWRSAAWLVRADEVIEQSDYVALCALALSVRCAEGSRNFRFWH